MKPSRSVTASLAAVVVAGLLYLAMAPWYDAWRVSRHHAISAIDFGPPRGAGADLFLPARWLNHHFRPYSRYCRRVLGEPAVMEF